MNVTRFFLYLFSCLVSFSAVAETWNPLPMQWDKAPINLGFLLDPPAGKHGFLGVKGDRFVFEDGTDFRVWGTTLTGSGCFPSQDMAPAVAERLYRFGFNLVRFHQLDAEWAEPNLFAPPAPGVDLLNSEAMDRLDYFLYQLESRGIYAWVDGLAARRLPPESNAPAASMLPPGLKGYIYFDPALQRLHQDFLQAFWNHRNRYTGNRYRDAPSIVMTELFHDNHLLLDKPRLQPYAGAFDGQWRQYLEERGADPSIPFDWDAPTTEMQQYLSQTMNRTAAQSFNFLRGFSVKAAITSTNAVVSAADFPLLGAFDFVHAEGLWNSPGMVSDLYTNRPLVDVDPLVEGDVFSHLAFSRIERKPFVASKWGEPWPCEYRAETPLWMAAMACFQDWRGCIASNYASMHDPEIGSIFAPLESFNDPCSIGLMPAAALLFYRGGVEPARKNAVMFVPESLLFNDEPVIPFAAQTTRLVHSMCVSVKPGGRASGKTVFSPTEPVDLGAYLNDSESQAMLRRDPERGLVFIDAPKAQAAIGRLDQIRFGELSGMDVVTSEPFAVVSLNSLNDLSISQSNRLWLTVVSQARNRGFRSVSVKDDSYHVEDAGRAPVTIKETPVRLFVRTPHSQWTIEAVDGNGSVTKTLPYQWEEGRLSFRAGTHGVMYYRLTAVADRS